jgi:hypothetical protein
MKTWKFALTLGLVAFALFCAPAGYAVSLVPDGTYVFTATDGDTPLNGSSVTFSGDTIVAWSLLDSLAASYNPFPPTDIPLTQSNSFINSFGVLGPDAWYFTIYGNNFGTTNYYDFFEGQNNLFGAGPGGGTGALYDGFGDPTGNWSLRAASTPDTGDTIWLFGGALVALGLCRLRPGFASR